MTRPGFTSAVRAVRTPTRPDRWVHRSPLRFIGGDTGSYEKPSPHETPARRSSEESCSGDYLGSQRTPATVSQQAVPRHVRGDRIKPAVIVTDDRTLGDEQLMLVSYRFKKAFVAGDFR
jgi:hypothetical protein